MAVAFRRKSQEVSALNVTPLIDVVFLLLVFFLLTSTFRAPTLDLTLPSSEATHTVAKRERVVVSISSSGQFMLNSKEVPSEMLLPELKHELSFAKDRTLYLRADVGTTYDKLFEVMSKATQAGASSFGLIHDKEKEQP